MSQATHSLVEHRTETLARALRKEVRGELFFGRDKTALYATDASQYQIEPLGAFAPVDQEDLRIAFQIAMEQRIPVVPRGGGTSLSGQTVGAGLVIDCSTHLHKILSVDLERKQVHVEPGVVLAQLNKHLKSFGYQFGPDVSTIDRACLGGMIANNSAGSRSIKYGMTADHVAELNMLLSDGSAHRLQRLSLNDFERHLVGNSRIAEAYRAMDWVRKNLAPDIAARFPKILRRVSGYSLDALIKPDGIDPTRLIVGSEGTLAFVTEAVLRMVPVPKAKGVAVLPFDDVDAGLSTLADLMSTSPSAIEMLDRMIIDLARQSKVYRSRVDFVTGDPAMILLVEYQADDESSVRQSFERMRKVLGSRIPTEIIATTEPTQYEHIWNVRKTALPLLFALPGARKPISFVEDTAVDPLKLGEFVKRFHAILERHQTTGSFYGHASVGCLHIRPLLDLSTGQGRNEMTAIAQEVFELVAEFGGSMSGEHGDGLARSVFNQQLFGPDVYDGFVRIKRAFDPLNLLNPGKIVDGPPITNDLRPITPKSLQLPTVQSFAEENGPLAIVDACNGNGLCRRLDIGVMCPSFQATREEMHSPRGRANLLRDALRERIETGSDKRWLGDTLSESLDLCLSCKACKTECVSSVDIAKLKAEQLQSKHDRLGVKPLERMMANYRSMAQWGSRFAPFSSLLMRNIVSRWAMRYVLGVDPRRKLPAFTRRPLSKWFERRQTKLRQVLGKVVLLNDCFTEFHEPQIGRAAVDLLERAGYQVHLASICCGRTMISKGFLRDARRLVEQHAGKLAGYVDDGAEIVGIEPSCLLTLKDEWRDLLPGEMTDKIADHAHLVESYLLDRRLASASLLEAPPAGPERVKVHGHCHQKAAGAVARSMHAIRELGNFDASLIDAGCCGMAGSFGYELGHYDVSVNIAKQRLLPQISAEPNIATVAFGFSCRCQIADLTKTRPEHPLELLHRRLTPANST